MRGDQQVLATQIMNHILMSLVLPLFLTKTLVPTPPVATGVANDVGLGRSGLARSIQIQAGA